MDLKSKIILISGPTASGKSDFAVKLAKKINGEIVNADSMQVYKELNILTARPSKLNLKKIKHHLYGFKSVKKKFSTGSWLKITRNKIKNIIKKNKNPILVGGTGLYFKALTDGLVLIPNISLKKRNIVRKLHKNLGQKKFYEKLILLDPLSKNKINSNDIQRSIRSYEIIKYTKKSLFQWFKKTKNIYRDNDFIKLYINYPREKLVKNITKRTDQMFKEGAVKEVKKFLKLKVRQDYSSTKIIGINEITKYLNKEIDLKQAKELIIIKTRQYAKRQRTWARGQMADWQKIEPQDIKSVLKKFNL